MYFSYSTIDIIETRALETRYRGTAVIPDCVVIAGNLPGAVHRVINGRN